MESDNQNSGKCAEDTNKEEMKDGDLETDGPDALSVPAVDFRMSVSSAEIEQEVVEPTDETPMIEAHNGKLQYKISDMEVVEVTEIEMPLKPGAPSVMNSDLTLPGGSQCSDMNSAENDSDKEGQERATWGGQLEFLLTCVGYAVGLGNVWRFPYLCYKNGGGAFIIPYCLMLAFVGLPLFYMELSLGQFASLGPITIWKFNPLLKGVGYASVIVNWLIALYYNVVVAQCIFYFFASMTSELPWSTCNNTWNTPNCAYDNATRVAAQALNLTITTPTEEYYRRYVLEQSDSITDFGTPRWKLTLCLLLAWIIVWLVLLKGIQSLGKVVYFTALFPYLMLTILLIRGVTLDGAIDGILFYLEPKFEKLLDPRVWSDAATQIFYSLSACTGGMIAMSSYNKFNNNCYRDSLIVACVNCATSIFAGFVIFSILGFIAHEKGVTVDEVATDGPGLAFEVYPEALAQMPVAPLWSVFFFLMMLTLGFGSEFSMVECLLSAFADEYPRWFTGTRVRSFAYRTGVIISCFLLGVPMTTNGGMWLLNLVDYSVSGFPLLFVGLLECIALCWIYHFDRFAEDIEMMLGNKPNLFWKICWKFVTPFIIAVVILMNVIFWKEPDLDDVTYPASALVVSWLIAMFPMAAIVGTFLYEYCYQSGGYELMKLKMQPTNDWGPANSIDRQRHQRYHGDFLPLLCMDPTLLGKIMGSNISNISNISEAEMTKRLGGLTPAQSEAVLQIIASSSNINGTPNLSPAASLLAIARSNGSFSQLANNQKKRSHTASECSEV
ncbi:sodium- and chloride-dependent glycine transporter 1-like [Mercenaria mercenaria]|uniref:sodium- and chloride-dependent glycine transporter 1-like n=1 Tax=Mercenaria mercenaria TaxID=6596 RepID=UPI00234EAB89|nr:sodium- and chloride-dependent glycine transporter 1-like [Mercenaria mercenaria]